MPQWSPIFVMGVKYPFEWLVAVETVHCTQAEDKFHNYYAHQDNTDPEGKVL